MFKTWQLLHRWTCNNQQLGICLVCLPLDKVLLSKPKRRQLKKKTCKTISSMAVLTGTTTFQISPAEKSLKNKYLEVLEILNDCRVLLSYSNSAQLLNILKCL